MNITCKQLQFGVILLLLILIIMLRNSNEHLTQKKKVTKKPAKKVVKKPAKKVAKKPAKKGAKKPSRASSGDSNSDSSSSSAARNNVTIYVQDPVTNDLREVSTGPIENHIMNIMNKVDVEAIKDATDVSKLLNKLPPKFIIKHQIPNKTLKSINATVYIDVPDTNESPYYFYVTGTSINNTGTNYRYTAVNNSTYDIIFNLTSSNSSNSITIDFSQLYEDNIPVSIVINNAIWE